MQSSTLIRISSNDKTLTELDLLVTSYQLEELSKALKLNDTIERLRVRDHSNDPDLTFPITDMIESLQQNKKLKSLELVDWTINGETISALVVLLQSNANITQLVLGRVSILGQGKNYDN